MDAEQTGNCSVHKSACGKIGTSIAELADLPREPFLRPHPQTDSGLTLALWAYASLGRQSPAPHTRKLDDYARPFATFALYLHPIDGDTT